MKETIEEWLKFVKAKIMILYNREETAEKNGFDIEVLSIQMEQCIFIDEKNFLEELLKEAFV